MVQTLHSPSSQQHHSTSGADLSQQPAAASTSGADPTLSQQPAAASTSGADLSQQPAAASTSGADPTLSQQPAAASTSGADPTLSQQPAAASTSGADPTLSQQPAAASTSDADEENSSGSENERPESGDDTTCTSDSDSEFDSQTVFDDWVVSLSLLDRKMLAVLLTETLQKRFNIKSTAAALEAAWVTGFNEKTVHYYRKEFMQNKGKFREEQRGKYKRICLFNDEDLRLRASMSTLVADDMRKILSNHHDFATEKTKVEHFLENEGLKAIFLPKFHCELNPIERVWGQAKKYTRAYTNFTLVRLRTIIDPALDSVSTDLIRKYFRRVNEYERAYLEGKKGGKQLEQAVKVFKSHRRIFFET